MQKYFQICNSETLCPEWYLEQLLWNCPNLNFSEANKVKRRKIQLAKIYKMHLLQGFLTETHIKYRAIFWLNTCHFISISDFFILFIHKPYPKNILQTTTVHQIMAWRHHQVCFGQAFCWVYCVQVCCVRACFVQVYCVPACWTLAVYATSQPPWPSPPRWLIGPQTAPQEQQVEPRWWCRHRGGYGGWGCKMG